MLKHYYLGLVLQCRYLLPTRIGQRGRVGHENQHASTNKPRPPVPSSMDVCELGGGSGPPRLHTGGAKNLWVKKNHHTRGERLKIATYNVRTLLKDEHVQELEDELKENNIKWDVIGLGEVRRKEESFTTLQSGHLLYHSEANNGQAGVGFLIKKEMERQHNKSILWEFQSCRTSPTHNRQIPTEDRSSICANDISLR